MYKYTRYMGIVLWALFRKVFGLVWYFVAVPFRKYARNTVYNYVLKNGIYLKRLLERPIEEHENLYIIAPYHNTQGGYIKKRDVSWIEYQLVVWFVWGWLDDDSNEDTFDRGYNNTIINGERLKWLPSFIKNSIRKVPKVQYGNSFDLGDAREPEFYFWASYLWTIRNTAYNFKYLLHEVRDDDLKFYWKGFGYNEDGRLVVKDMG